MRWLHLSDIHFDPKGAGIDTCRLRKKLHSHIKDSKIEVEHVFITGDFREASRAGDAEKAAHAAVKFIKEVAESAGVTDSAHIHIVPGNHDLDRDDAAIPEIIRKKYPLPSSGSDNESASGELKYKKVLQAGELTKYIVGKIRSGYDSNDGRFDETELDYLLGRFSFFQRVEKILHPDKSVWPETLRPLHPYCHFEDFSLLYMNTVIACVGNESRGHLVVGTKDLYSALEEIGATKPIIVLAHHSPDHFAENERRKVESIFQDYKKVALYLCGDDHVAWPRRVNGISQLTAGCLKQDKQDKKSVRPVFFSGELSGGKVSVVNAHWWDGDDWGKYLQFDEKARELFGLATPSCDHNLPEAPSKYFTKRKKEQTDIERGFGRGERISLTQTIAGLGGVGKTQLALEYAWRQCGNYDVIRWMNAESETSVYMAYRDFAVQKQLADEKAEAAVVIKAVRDWMEQNERWLFIFDNAESSEVLKKYLPLQQQGTRHVLITSRYAYWYGVAETVEVGVFRPEQAEEFLTEATKKPADNNQKKLAQELGYLPLALDQAAAYINVHQKSYSEYLELFRKRRLEVLKKFPSADKNRQTVATTWDISIEKIGETSAARQLFNLCAFFAPEDIARRWFQKSCAVLPEPLRTAVPDELAYDEITETICRYSLATRRQGNLSLHRLVQEVIRDSMGGEREYWANLCISALINCIYDDFSTLENRVEFLTLLPHITATTGHAETTLPEEKAKLYDFAGRGSYELAMFDSALEWFGRALTISEKVFGKDHPDTATSDNNIAVVYHSQGDYPKAIEWHQKALDIFEKVLGKEHQATAATYNNIANVYDSQGDYPEALKWHRKALAVKEKVPGKDHPDTATSYNNIALVYYSQGDYPKALKWHRKALAVKEKVLGKEHPDTAASYNNIANVYHSQGDYPEALEWHKKALAVKEKVRGKDHPNTAMSYGNIANVYDSQGDYPEALKWHKKALAVKEKVLGKGHPDTAMSYHNIANVYHNQGDSPKALEWFLSAFTIFARTLGHNHPKTKTALGNMAETYKETTMSLPFEKWLAEKLHWK